MILKFDSKTPGREDSGEVKLASKQEARGKYGLKVQNVGQASPDITASRAPVVEGKELSKKEKTHQQALGLIEAHGGPDNIVDVNACITRLRIDVKDQSLVDKDTIIKKYEALGFVENGMQMQSIYGAYANVLKMEIQDILGLEE